MQWHTQASSITNNLKVKIDFILPELSATKNVTRNCHVYEYANVRYDTNLGIDLLKNLGLNIK